MKKKLQKRVFSISSSVGYGQVGLSILPFMFAALNISSIELPTVFFASRPDLGTISRHDVQIQDFKHHLNSFYQDGLMLDIEGVLTGYFASVEQVQITSEFLKKIKDENPQLLILIDPVLGDFDCGLYVPFEVANAIKRQLLPLADVITPNLFEFLWLSDQKLKKINDFNFIDFAQGYKNLSIEHVVVTSAFIEQENALQGAKISTMLFEKGAQMVFKSQYFDLVPKGTGDIFAASMMGELLRGNSWQRATQLSVNRLEKIADKAQGESTIEPYLLFLLEQEKQKQITP